MDLDGDAAFVVGNAHAPVTRQMALDEPAHAVHLLRGVRRVPGENVRGDRRVLGHQAGCSTSSVTSGRAKKRNGMNVVPRPGDTCIHVPARS